MIHWRALHRASLSPILTHKRYCWSCSSGQRGRPYARPVNAGLIWALPDAPADSKELRKAPLGLPQNVIYCSSVSGAVIYSILCSWTKRTPAIIQEGPFALQQRRPVDCGHQAAWPRGLTLLCFHWPLFLLPPSEPKTSVLPTPPPLLFSLPPSPTHSSHTHTNKEMGPLQFILLALWNPGLLQGSGGKK